MFSAESSARRRCSERARRACRTDAFLEFLPADIEQSIPARFEKQVRAYPDHTAVKTDAGGITYAELNGLANGVARTIRSRLGDAREPVALLLDNRILSIAAMLGVLKAGKFYVPLEGFYPLARNRYVLDDSRARCILADAPSVALARQLAQDGRQWVQIDEVGSERGPDRVGPLPGPDDFAYIVYTSGSTGEPRGVLQNHRNVLHFIMNYTNGLHICPTDRLSLLYTWGNSAAAMDTFAALLNGASLLPFRLREEGTAGLGKWLRSEGITVYHSVASVFRSFVRSLSGEEKFPVLRVIDFGGEPVHASDLEIYKKHFSPDCVLVNGFGSTEINVARQFFVDMRSEVNGPFVPIGYPVRDTEVFLLKDSGEEEAGIGVPGEICIESPYLALGYWNNSEQTRVAFLPSPKGNGFRIFHSGDLGLREPDGCLRHLGRKDAQVKIRGFRVETAEIEGALRREFQVADAVVVSREYGPDDRRLVAYVVPGRNPVPSQSALRKGLAKWVPDYMIPAAFVTLEALPVTTNGKIDRRALPAPGPSRPPLDTPFVPPRSPLEEMLAEIWVDVLGIGQIGVNDNFFELGGNSLLAARVVSRLHHTLDVDLSLRRFFAAPTVAGLALAVVQGQAAKGVEEETRRILEELEELSTEGLQHAAMAEIPDAGRKSG